MGFLCLFLWLLALLRFGFIVMRELDPHADAWARNEEDEEFRYSVARGKNRVVDSVVIGFRLPGKHRFAMRPEGVFDPLGHWLGLAREFQTGDAAFDNRIYVDCEDPRLHDALVANRELRNAIFALLPVGTGRRLRCANGWLWFSAPVEGAQKDLSDERIALEVLRGFQPALLNVRDELRMLAGLNIHDATHGRRRFFAGVTGICVVAGAIGGLLHVSDERLQLARDGIARTAGWWTAGVAAVLLVMLFARLRKIPRTHTLLADVLLAALPATWVAAWGGAMYFNQAFDVAPAVRVTLSTNQIHATKKAKGEGKSYYIVVPDERGARKVDLWGDEYLLVAGRPCVDLQWRRGRLGDEWIEEFLPSDHTSCELEVERQG